MGHTHYHRIPKELGKAKFNKLLKDCRQIAGYLDYTQELKLSGETPDKPSFEPDYIFLNGIEGEDHESFEVNRVHNSETDMAWISETEDGMYYYFCKTANKPYNLAVICILLAMKHHFPECVISTDGDAKEWQEAIDICQELFGYGEGYKIENIDRKNHLVSREPELATH